MLSTASVDFGFPAAADAYVLSTRFPDKSQMPPREGIDFGLTAILALCDIVAEKKIRPIAVELTSAAQLSAQVYCNALSAPVTMNNEIRKLYFDKKTLDEPLTHAAPAIAKATVNKLSCLSDRIKFPLAITNICYAAIYLIQDWGGGASNTASGLD